MIIWPEQHAYCVLFNAERKLFYLKSSLFVSIIKIESYFRQTQIIAKHLVQVNLSKQNKALMCPCIVLSHNRIKYTKI